MDVSAEALHRKIYAAPKRAVIGGGGNWIEPLRDLHFPGWPHMLDFVHLLVHLFAIACLAYAKDASMAWKLYRLEAVSQIRAAHLSEDGRTETFHELRPRGPAVGRNRAHAFQPAG